MRTRCPFGRRVLFAKIPDLGRNRAARCAAPTNGARSLIPYPSQATAKVAPTVAEISRRAADSRPYGQTPTPSFFFVGAGHWPARRGSLRFQSPPSSASHALGTFPLLGGRLSGGRKGRPYIKKQIRIRSVSSATPGAGVEPHHPNFCNPRAQWPGRNLERYSDFMRRKFCSNKQECVPP